MSAIATYLEYGKRLKIKDFKFFDILKPLVLKNDYAAPSIVKIVNGQKIGFKTNSTEN